MNHEISETVGLSLAQARLLRTLFQFNDHAGRTRAERRDWLLAQLRASEGKRLLGQLLEAGLVTRDYRLTWMGLALAVNLPPLAPSLCDPLAA